MPKRKAIPTIPKRRKVKPWISAKLLDGNGQFMRFLRVPVILEGTQIPLLHTALRLSGGEVAVLRATTPVTYKWCGKSPLLKEQQ